MDYWNRYRLLQTLQAIAALFIVAGLMTAAAGVREYRASVAVAGWPTADGTIRAAETIQAEQRGRSLTYFDAAHIVYAYMVGGRAYENDRIDLADRPARIDSDDGRRLFALYPPGAAVPVYYNPADPADSLLERAPQVAALRAGAGLVALGLVVLLARYGGRIRG